MEHSYFLRFLKTLVVILTIIASFLIGRKYSIHPQDVIVSHDTTTIVIHDTIHITHPELVKETIIGHDTVWITLPSSIPSSSPDGVLNVFADYPYPNYTADSIPVSLVRVYREFSGDNYHAWVSGCCNPMLEKIDIFQDKIETTVTIREKEKSKHWGVGIQAGTTYSFSDKHLQPYIGVGISYNLLRW